MAKQEIQITNPLLWFFCALIALAGIGVSVHAVLNFDQAKVTVEWTTASELNTVGFNLLRGESAAGPFAQINKSLIPSASDTLTGNQYSYEDSDVKAGTTYFYMLEELESSGGANQHGPITVKASSSGYIELIIGGFLIGGAIVFSILLLRDQKLKEIEGV